MSTVTAEVSTELIESNEMIEPEELEDPQPVIRTPEEIQTDIDSMAVMLSYLIAEIGAAGMMVWGADKPEYDQLSPQLEYRCSDTVPATPRARTLTIHARKSGMR